MKVKAWTLPLILAFLALRTDYLRTRKYRKPVRNLFYMASQLASRPSISPVQKIQEPTDVIEYYGNTKGAQGTVAVLSLNGEVFTVREGELLGKRYRVVKIFSDKVILLDEKKKKKITVKIKEG